MVLSLLFRRRHCFFAVVYDVVVFFVVVVDFRIVAFSLRGTDAFSEGSNQETIVLGRNTERGKRGRSRVLGGARRMAHEHLSQRKTSLERARKAGGVVTTHDSIEADVQP